jgi:hypothetical protein
MQIAYTKSVLNKKKNTSIAVKSPFDFLFCNCVILRTNKGDQINLVLFLTKIIVSPYAYFFLSLYMNQVPEKLYYDYE